MYIYKIMNIVNNKVYIGQTTKKYVNYRFSNHIYELNKKEHHNEHLQRSWDKYGKKCFKFEIVEIWATLDDLNKREIYWIAHFKATDPKFGYNIALGGKGTHSVSPLTRQKLSIKGKGNKSRTGQKDTPEMIEAKRKRMLGKKLRPKTKEEKEHLSKYWKGEKSRFYGKLGVNAKSVICVTTGKIYPSSVHAAKDTNCDRSTICKLCRAGGGITKGLEFKYT